MFCTLPEGGGTEGKVFCTLPQGRATEPQGVETEPRRFGAKPQGLQSGQRGLQRPPRSIATCTPTFSTRTLPTTHPANRNNSLMLNDFTTTTQGRSRVRHHPKTQANLTESQILSVSVILESAAS